MSANPYKCYDKIIEQLKKVLRETEDFLRKHYESTKDNGIKTVYETLANLDVIDPPIAIGLLIYLQCYMRKVFRKAMPNCCRERVKH